MEDEAVRAQMIASTHALMARLEGDRLRQVDPVDTWASIHDDIDKYKATILSSQGSTDLEHILISLVADLFRTCEDQYSQLVKLRQTATDASVQTAG